MGLFEILFSNSKQNVKQAKSKEQLRKERQKLDRKLWELAEEYEEED